MADDDLTPSLVAQLREGDAGAAGLLERLYRPALTRFCRGYLDDDAEAEDAVQDVFAAVLESPEVPDRFRVWLYTVARNRCLNLRRGRRRRVDDQRLRSGVEPAAPSAAGFLTEMVAREQREDLDHAFAALPTPEQEALRLRYAEALSRPEIAAVLDIPVSVVKSRLYEGLKRLRARLDST